MGNMLVDLERKINQQTEVLKSVTDKYEIESNSLKIEIQNFCHKRNIILDGYDLDKIENAKRFICTNGVKKNFYGDAGKILNEVIKDITDGCKNICEKYFGCKDYDRFVGQGISCDYGLCPSYGSVVMKICATSDFRSGIITPNDDDLSDILYFLYKIANEKDRNKILREYE